jgi:hypothetical protein
MRDDPRDKELAQAFAGISDNAEKVVQISRDMDALRRENYILRQKLAQRDNGLKWISSIAYIRWSHGRLHEQRLAESLLTLIGLTLLGTKFKDYEKSNAQSKQDREQWLREATNGKEST